MMRMYGGPGYRMRIESLKDKIYEIFWGPGIRTQVLKHFAHTPLPSALAVLFLYNINNNYYIINKRNNKIFARIFKRTSKVMPRHHPCPPSVAKRYEDLYLRTTSVATNLQFHKIKHKPDK